MRKRRYKSFNKMMLRLRDIEKLMLLPDGDKILQWEDYIKLPDERDWILDAIFKYYPKEIRA